MFHKLPKNWEFRKTDEKQQDVFSLYLTYCAETNPFTGIFCLMTFIWASTYRINSSSPFMQLMQHSSVKYRRLFYSKPFTFVGLIEKSWHYKVEKWSIQNIRVFFLPNTNDLLSPDSSWGWFWPGSSGFGAWISVLFSSHHHQIQV